MKPAPLIRPPSRDAAPAPTHRTEEPFPPPLVERRDEELAALITHLAGQLGIDASRITVRQDQAAQAAARSKAVSAFAEQGIVHLREPMRDAGSRACRHLIAHEAAHVAQSLRPGAAFARIGDVRAPAEIEAEVFARRYAETRTGKPVAVPLPAVPAAREGFDMAVEAVARAHAEEIAFIVDRLSYGLFDWGVTDDDILDVLRVLDMVPMLTARAMASAIGGKMRGRFFGNLNAVHYSAYRMQILAVGWAAESKEEFAEGDNELLAKVDLANLEPLEAVAVAAIAGTAPPVREAAEADAKRKARIAEAETYAADDKARAELTKAKDEADKEEQRAGEEKKKAREAAELLDPNDELRTLAARIETALDEFHVSDAEALGLLDAIGAASLRGRDAGERVRLIVSLIGDKRLDELIDQLPTKGLYASEERRRTFVHLLSTRPAFKNLRAADDLLDSPWFAFWDPITSEDAYLAFLLVKSMPDRARAAVIKAFGGEKWGLIVDELTQNIRESADFSFYTGGEKNADREAILIGLTDASLWDGSQPDRLDAVLRIAQAAGESAFAFKQSKQYRADTVPALKGLVGKYRLYVKDKRETYSEPELEGHAWYEEGVFGKIAGVYRFFKLLFGLRNWRIFGGFAADVDLNDLHDYGNAPTRGSKEAPMIRGARFRPTTSEQRSTARDAGQIPENVLRFVENDSIIEVAAPRLVIDKLAFAGESRITGAPATCLGLKATIRLVPKTRQVQSAELSIDELAVADLAIARRDSIYAVNNFVLRGLRARLTNEALSETAPNDGLGAIFGALASPEHASGVRLSIDLLRMLGVATSSGLYIQSIEIDSIDFMAGGTGAAYVDALRASETRLGERLEEERKALAQSTEPDETKRREGAVARLGRQLEKIRAEMAAGHQHGTVIDIRRVRLSGIPGLSEDPTTLEDVHGQGASVTGPMPLFGDVAPLRDLIRGKGNAPTVRGEGAKHGFGIDIGTIESKKPLRLVGDIPGEAAAQKDLDTFIAESIGKRGDANHQDICTLLTRRAAEAARLEALVGRGIRSLSEDEVREVGSLRASLRAFEQRRAMIVETLRIEELSLNVDERGLPEVAAGRVLATGIAQYYPDGSEALRIGGIDAEGLKFKAQLNGGLANFKAWREALTSAEVEAKALTFRDIRHGDTGAVVGELAFTADATAPGLQVRLDRNSATKDTNLHVRSGRISATGINAPVQAMLLHAERDRIAAMPETDRAPEETKRLATINDMLADLKAIDDAEIKAQASLAAAKAGKARAAAQRELDAAVAARKHWQERLVIEKLTIEHLDVSLSGLGNVLDPDYKFDTAAAKLKVRGNGENGRFFEQASAEGISIRGAKGNQTIAAKIGIGPVGGEIERTAKGWAVKGLAIGRIAARGLSYQSGTMSVASLGESQIIGLTVNAEIETGGAATTVRIGSLGIDRIVADQLRYEDGDKIVSIISGELLGLKVSGLEAVMPEDPKAKTQVSGQISIHEVKALTLNAAASGYGINGVINGKARQPNAQAISVTLARSGERTIALSGIHAAADVREIATGNKIRVAWKNLSGTLTQNGDQYTVKDLSVGNLTLSRADWKVGGKQILIHDKVTLEGISLDAEAALRPKPAKKGDAPLKEGEEPTKELASLLVKRLKVDTIQAKAAEVVIPAVEANAREGTAYSARKSIIVNQATISGLLVTGFDVLGMKGKVAVTDRVTMDARAVIGEAARHDLKTLNASATLFGMDTDEPGQGGRELSATLNGADGMLIRLGRISEIAITDVDAQGREVGKGGVTDSLTRVGRASLANITTGDLIVTDDLVSVSDIEIAGPIGISGVLWNVTGADRQQITMASATIHEPMRVGKVEATFHKVATGKKKNGRDEMRSELATATMTRLVIPKLTATQLRYQGAFKTAEGSRSIDLLLPNAVVAGISVDSLAKDYLKNLMSVNAKIKSVAAPGFTATLTDTLAGQIKTKTFGADLTTGEIRADAIFKTVGAGTPDEKTELDSGGFELDKLGLRNITGTLRDSKDPKAATLGARPDPSVAPSLDVASIKHDKAGTSVTGTSLKNLHYSDPNLGLKVDFDSLLVPDTVSIPKSGAVTIPAATVTRAGFEIADLMQMMNGSKGGGGNSEKLDTEQFYGILDHINGNVKCNAYIPIHLKRITDGTDLALRQEWFPIDIEIKNGKINYRNLWSHTVYDRYKPLASLGMQGHTTYEMGISGDVVPVQDMSNSWLALNVTTQGDVLKWTPGDDAERTEMTGGDVRLKRLIRFDEKPKDPNDSGPDPVYTEEMRFEDFEAALNIGGQIPLNLGSMGKISLGTPGKGGVTALKLNKQSYNLTKATGRPSVATTWTLEQMGVTVEELNLGGVKLGGTIPTAGATFTIAGIEDGEIDFGSGSLMQPRRLKGTINKAEVRNLTVNMGETR